MAKVDPEMALQVAEMEPWTMSVALAAAKLTVAPLAEVALADSEAGQVIVGGVTSAAEQRAEMTHCDSKVSALKNNI